MTPGSSAGVKYHHGVALVSSNLMMAMNWPKHVVWYWLEYTFFISTSCVIDYPSSYTFTTCTMRMTFLKIISVVTYSQNNCITDVLKLNTIQCNDVPIKFPVKIIKKKKPWIRRQLSPGISVFPSKWSFLQSPTLSMREASMMSKMRIELWPKCWLGTWQDMQYITTNNYLLQSQTSTPLRYP